MKTTEVISTCDSKIKETLHQQEVMTQAIDKLLEVYKSDETKREKAVELINRLMVHKSNCDWFIKEYETIMEDTLHIERYGQQSD